MPEIAPNALEKSPTPSNSEGYSWFRYCPHAKLDAAIALGWRIVDTALIAHHDHYSLLVEWPELCNSEPPWIEKTC